MLRVADWKANFEISTSRRLKTLLWVAVPTKMTGSGYTALLDHDNGAAHLGAWLAIIEAAAVQDIRGMLPRAAGRDPHDIPGICRSLARLSRISAAVFEEAIPRLLGDEIAWLEVVDKRGNPIEVSSVPVEDEVPEPGQRFYPPLQPAPAPPRAMRWKTDDVFYRFVEQYKETGAPVIDEDFTEAYEYCWKRLDWEQKAARVKALEAHFEEYQGNPRFVKKPLAFLEKEWQRPVRPPVKSAAGPNKQAQIDDDWGGARATR